MSLFQLWSLKDGYMGTDKTAPTLASTVEGVLKQVAAETAQTASPPAKTIEEAFQSMEERGERIKRLLEGMQKTAGRSAPQL